MGGHPNVQLVYQCEENGLITFCQKLFRRKRTVNHNSKLASWEKKYPHYSNNNYNWVAMENDNLLVNLDEIDELVLGESSLAGNKMDNKVAKCGLATCRQLTLYV